MDGEAQPGAANPETAWGTATVGNGRVDTFETSDEVARLEALLATRAEELAAQRAELARVRELLRDATRDFEHAAARAPDTAQVAELRNQREAAVGRALEAEAARVELGFRLDELLGHMAQATLSGGVSAPTEPQREPLDVTCARLNGTVRGLMSVLAETEEARDSADARLVLADQDLGVLAGRARLLERELAEAREQIELEAVRSHALAQKLEGSVPARTAARLGGEAAGLRARCDEFERTAETLASALAFARGRTAAPDTVEDSARIPELERMLEHETEKGREATAAHASVLAERMVLREELTRAQADVAGLRNALATLTGELDAERNTGRRGVTEQRARAERLHDALREARHVLGELSGALERASTPPPPEPLRQDDTSGNPTQPGMPTYIEAMEGLEELVALRDEHIRSLTTALQLERDRVRSIERMVQGLEPSSHLLPTALWTELLQLMNRR
jgi:hypothetical protein